ncbi:MAG TPA: hypothetical protein VG860_10350 [Terriglobia bacterium]|jgi:hypothetical protein|nr:hypothetical protein [Terriglobia bacterium]
MAHTPEDLIWAQINRQLVDLKIQQANAEFRATYTDRRPDDPEGNRWGQFVRWGDIHLERTNTWVEKVYAIYTEVWEKQGKTKTADFVRVVLKKALVPAIDGRIQTAKARISTTFRTTHSEGSLAALLASMTRKADQLKSEWVRKIEIEAHELQLEWASAGRQSSQGVAEGATGEPDFWDDLEKRFRTLHSQGGWNLRADWISTRWNPDGDKWCLGGNTRQERKQFQWLAERAAVRLQHTDVPTALFFWLDLLKDESPNFRVGITYDYVEGGTVIHATGGRIEKLCEASADYCVRCHTQETIRTRADKADVARELSTASQPIAERFRIDLATWRRDRPEQPFSESRDEIEELLSDGVSNVPLELLQEGLAYYESDRARLLAVHPELETLISGEPWRPYEQEFELCEMLIPIFRLEIARRQATGPAESVGVSSRGMAGQSSPASSPPIHVEATARPLLSKYRSELKRGILMQLIQHPDASDLEICRGLDADGAVELPADLKKGAGDRSFHEAYMDKSRRHRIEITISKVRADLRELGLLAKR